MKQFTPSRPKRIGDDSPELVPTEKRKRRSGELISLGLSAHELKYRKETQKGYYADKKSPSASDKVNIRCNGAVKASWDHREDFLRWKAENVTEDFGDDGITVSMQMGKEMSEENKGKRRKPLSPGGIRFRRFAIQYFYDLYGAPPENEWGDFDAASSLPTLIMKHLIMPDGSYASVVLAQL